MVVCFIHYAKRSAVSIPLSRIESFAMDKFLDFTNVVSIKISKAPPSLNHSWDNDDSDASSQQSNQSSDENSIDLEGLDLKFCAMTAGNCWAEFGKLVERATERERVAKQHVSSKIIVDFGELSFFEQQITSHGEDDDKERAIRRALGLNFEEPIWCTYFLALDRFFS